MKYISKERAKEWLDGYKDQTAYFTGELNYTAMREMFRQMHFGVAETETILAALVLAGAKFTL